MVPVLFPVAQTLYLHFPTIESRERGESRFFGKIQFRLALAFPAG
jgi:hypothetical protein